MTQFYDILKQLLRVPSVVGAEHPFLIYLKRELEELELEVEFYDGLLVAKGSNPESGYLSAHADRHGLICTGKNEFQYAAFLAKNQTNIKEQSIQADELLKNFTKRFVDEKVQAYEPYSGSYMGMGTIKETYLCERRENIIFKIDGLSHIHPGTPIAFMDKLSIKEDTIYAQLDNTISVASILYLYQKGYQGTAFFTASEEAGMSWIYLLDYFKKYDLSTNELLVLDTSPYKTKEEIDLLDIVLRNRDQNGYFKSPLKQKIKRIAIERGIKYHYKDEYLKSLHNQNNPNNTKAKLGITELGRIIKASKGSVQGTTLQIPTIGYHTSNETANKKSIKLFIEVLKKVYNL